MNRKKKILVVSHALELGGAERSLIGLLDAFDAEKYDVDLFLLRCEGELLKDVPDNINVLPEISAYTVLARPMKETLLEGHIFLTATRLLGKVAARVYEKLHSYVDSGVQLEYSHKYTAPLMPKINPGVEYDLAISFLTPHYFVAKKVNAKKKIAWIHTDYTQVQVNAVSELKMWGKYDTIVSISSSVTEGFLKTFPSLKSKICEMENILPKRLIEKEKEAFDASEEMPPKGIRLLSIGRYCRAKNFDNVPEICSLLIDKGLDVYWYIIGFGSDEQLIRKKIAEFGMEKRVILLGKKENPYPYVKTCDVYVQPSRYEGKCVAVREAQLLGKPVVITNYATAKSQLEDGVDGVIVPMENKECAESLALLLQNENYVNEIAADCARSDYSNAEEITKLLGLIEQIETGDCYV